jgi:hypothetical protein
MVTQEMSGATGPVTLPRVDAEQDQRLDGRSMSPSDGTRSYSTFA